MKNQFVRHKIILIRFEENGQSWIQVVFPMKYPYRDIVKEISNRQWHRTRHCLYIPDTKKHISEVFSLFKGICWVDISQLKERREAERRGELAKLVPQAYVDYLKRLNYSCV